MGVWARSVGVDTGSFMISSTFADSATDSPPGVDLSTPVAVPVAGALLVWRRRRVALSERVSRVRAVIMRLVGVAVLIGGVGNLSISKTPPFAGQVQLPGTELQVCTKVLLVRDQSIQ